MEHKQGELVVWSLNNPFIYTIDDFIPEKVIDDLVEDIEKHGEFQKAKVVSNDGTGTSDIRRTNSSTSLHYLHSPSAVAFLNACSNTLRLHQSQAEPLSIIKYQKGEQYEGHHDAFTLEQIEQYVPQAGNRVATALLYLCDVQDGGETDFPQLNITVKPKKGRCVFFQNTHTGTEVPLETSFHASLPVIRGEKMACNLWFRRGVYDNNLYQKWLESEKSV